MTRYPLSATLLVAVLSAPAALPAQAPADSLSLAQIAMGELYGEFAPEITWLRDGNSWLEMRQGALISNWNGIELVRVDAGTGAERVVSGKLTVVLPGGDTAQVMSAMLSPDERRVLLLHSWRQVGPRDRRGYYHILDLESGTTAPLSADSGMQKLAQFSPDGSKIAFVRGGNLVVADLGQGTERRLTADGNETILNGAPDWSYEEEFGLSSAFRWSPDSRRIAFWRFDQSEVPLYPIQRYLPNTPTVSWSHYPRVGEPIPRIGIGIVELARDSTTWVDLGSDEQYVPRMDWAGNDSVTVQRLPRRQDRIEVLMASATTGRTRTLLSESDSAWIDAESGVLEWLAGGRQFLWLSDRTGWRQIFLHDRGGEVVRQITRDSMDVVSVAGVDTLSGYVYVVAASPTPTQRQVFRYRTDRREEQRVTSSPGAHDWNISPNGRWAVTTWSDRNTLPRTELLSLPGGEPKRQLIGNDSARARLEALRLPQAEAVQVPAADGTLLNGWRIAPVPLEPGRRYPVIMNVYGGPSAPSATDQYLYLTNLWGQWFAQHGFIFITIDNRGAEWRGRDFRKVTAGRIGLPESDDQIAVSRWLATQPWADGGRIGIYGMSYGGYLSGMAAARGGSAFRAAALLWPATEWRQYDAPYTERYMGLLAENTAGYDTSSIMTHVDSLTARLLLVHGTADDNVHFQQTAQLTQRLVRAGKLFTMMVYPDYRHGPTGGPAHLIALVSRFFLENL